MTKARSGCIVTANVPSNEAGNTGTITFRGTHHAVEFAKELVEAICCQRDWNHNINIRERMFFKSITTCVSDMFTRRLDANRICDPLYSRSPPLDS